MATFDKQNKDIVPPSDLLKPDQEWKFTKSGWRRQKKVSDEEKQQRVQKLQAGKKAAKETRVEDTQELISSIKSLNDFLKSQHEQQKIIESEKAIAKDTPKETPIETPKETVSQSSVEEKVEQVVQAVYKNPLLAQWLK